jgi:hypothetical protein
VDVPALAAQAVALVANHLQALASGLVASAEASAVGRLYDLMRAGLRRTDLGAAVLGGLEEQPGAPGRRDMTASALAETVLADEEFAARLRQAVHEVSLSQGAADLAAISGQVNIGAGGDLTMARTNVAGGDIDASRRYHIGTGGIVLLIAVAVALVAGTTTAVVVGMDDGDRDPAAMGRAPGEAGVREAAEGYLEVLAAPDPVRYCGFLSADEVRYAVQFGGCERAAQDFVFSRLDRMEMARVDRVTIDEEDACADVSYGAEKMLLYLEREEGRWVIAEDVFPRDRELYPPASETGGDRSAMDKYMAKCRRLGSTPG